MVAAVTLLNVISVLAPPACSLVGGSLTEAGRISWGTSKVTSECQQKVKILNLGSERRVERRRECLRRVIYSMFIASYKCDRFSTFVHLEISIFQV